MKDSAHGIIYLVKYAPQKIFLKRKCYARLLPSGRSLPTFQRDVLHVTTGFNNTLGKQVVKGVNSSFYPQDGGNILPETLVKV
jgi:hypothetical protein